MKSLQMFKGWFWSHECFRRLRPRLMTMILALVLPVCLICVVISVISIVQSRELTYQIGNNGLSSFLKTAALQFEQENWDPLTDFPAGVSEKFSHFHAYVEAYNGKVYVSRNGSQAFLLSNDGSYAESPEEFEALRKNPYKYEWQGEELPFRVLVTFPYHFALVHVPFVLWIGLIISMATLMLSLFCTNGSSLTSSSPWTHCGMPSTRWERTALTGFRRNPKKSAMIFC